MRPLRILSCTLGVAPGPVGGAERQAWLQARELTKRGHSVTMICPAAPGVRNEVRDGIRIRRLPRFQQRVARTISYPPVLFTYLLARAGTYDLIHVHLANLQADVVAIASRIRRRPYYVKIATGGPRGEIDRLAVLAPITRRVGVRWADRVQAISDEIEGDLRGVGVAGSKIVRIPNGFDVTGIRPPTRDEQLTLRRDLALPEDGLIALYAGRFAGYKGILDLLEAWRLPTVPPATLVIVGEEAADDPVSLPDAVPGVIVRGWSADILRYHRAADIVVHPSHADGMSNTLLEAMATGRAIAATRVAAAPAMLGDDEAGLLVPARSPKDLRAAIDRLIADPALRDRLGMRARQVVLDRYAIDAVVDRIEAEYEELLRERRA